MANLADFVVRDLGGNEFYLTQLPIREEKRVLPGSADKPRSPAEKDDDRARLDGPDSDADQHEFRTMLRVADIQDALARILNRNVTFVHRHGREEYIFPGQVALFDPQADQERASSWLEEAVSSAPSTVARPDVLTRNHMVPANETDRYAFCVRYSVMTCLKLALLFIG